MCYSAMMANQAAIIEAVEGIPFDQALRIIKERWDQNNRWTGAFGRPFAPVLTSDDRALLARWTYLPKHIKSEAQADVQVQYTANCMAEEMFSKRTWAEPARQRRGILILERYYENQHRVGPKGGKITVPFRFSRPNSKPFAVGVLWGQDWEGTPCFAICTMPPTELARWVHNNPTAVNGPRQPLMFRDRDEIKTWLFAGENESSIEHLWQVREDGFVVAGTTLGSTGKFPKKLPPEPDGRPAVGVVDFPPEVVQQSDGDTAQGELF